jgi:hypothetical protein
MPPLEHDVVALEAIGEVVPRAGYETVFSLEVLDRGLQRGLWSEGSID